MAKDKEIWEPLDRVIIPLPPAEFFGKEGEKVRYQINGDAIVLERLKTEPRDVTKECSTSIEEGETGFVIRVYHDGQLIAVSGTHPMHVTDVGKKLGYSIEMPPVGLYSFRIKKS